jgi:hypothetical protein
MAPRLPKYVVTRIEAVMNVTADKGSEIDVKRIAYEFSTTERSIQRIRRGLVLRRAMGIDLYKRAGN